jgi:pimeloyl-ACP methyl ester carboxylesterase
VIWIRKIIPDVDMDELATFVRVGSCQIEVRWARPPSMHSTAPQDTIVCLHEGLGSVSQWRDWPDRLAAATGRAVLAYSRPGYGASTPLTPFGPDFLKREAREVLPAVLEALSVKRPVLYGHSDGATIALLYAAVRPHQVRALIVESPHVFVEDCTLQSIAALTVPARFADLSRRLARHHADPKGVLRRWTDAWLSPAFKDWRCDGDLATITCPTLLIQGLADEYGTLAHIDAIASAVMGPVSQLVLATVGHSPHREAAEDVLSAVRSFLAGA